MQVAAVILAAGASTRFGSPKQRVRIGGRTMLDMVAAAAREVGLDPVVAVVPPDLDVPPDVVRSVNAEPEAGISRSLRLGLDAVPPGVEAAVILLGDEPMVDAGDLLELMVLAESGAEIVATRAGERIGPPVLLARSRFGLADDAVGDQGLGPLLRSQPDLRTVEAARTPRDIDTPNDLAAATEVCPGCGARFLPVPEGPTHGYIDASPACWAAFNELLAREFADPAYGMLHRHTADIYAVQHPGHDDRRERQSVAIHLVGLCDWLERGVGSDAINARTQALVAGQRDWPWLAPPAGYRVTVVDVVGANDPEEYAERVRMWGASAWEAWSAHHDLVRRWAGEVTPD